MIFTIYQQRPPKKVGPDEWIANVVKVGELDAPDGPTAIRIAKETMTQFVIGTFGRHPMVVERRQ